LIKKFIFKKIKKKLKVQKIKKSSFRNKLKVQKNQKM